MITIIAGSRGFDDLAIMADTVSKAPWRVTRVISGGARGADQMGEQWGLLNHLPVDVFPADWDKYGKVAGIRRNESMARVGQGLIALWDGESRGTAHMIREARAQGLKVFVYNYITEKSND